MCSEFLGETATLNSFLVQGTEDGSKEPQVDIENLFARYQALDGIDSHDFQGSSDEQADMLEHTRSFFS